MPVTSPDNLSSPDGGSPYALTTDMAISMNSVQLALNNLRASIPSLTPRRVGTNAQRIALGGANLYAGLEFWTTDTRLTWIYDGGRWLVAPGQVLASMESNTSTSAVGGQLGTTLTITGLSIGQRLRIMSNGVGASSASQSVIAVTSVRNNTNPVTYAANDKVGIARAATVPAGYVVTLPSVDYIFTTTSAAQVTCALYNQAGVIYGSDTQRLMVVSA